MKGEYYIENGNENESITYNSILPTTVTERYQSVLNREFESFHVLRLNASLIPVQIVESRGAPSSYAVLKKFLGLAC